MRFFKPRSLRWLLVQRLTLTQGILIFGMSFFSLALISALMLSNWKNNGVYETNVAEALGEAAARDSQGKLYLKNTAELSRLRSENPNLWFIISDTQGNEIKEGTLPSRIAEILPILHYLLNSRFGTGDNSTPADAILSWQSTEAGNLRMLTPTLGRVTFWKILRESTPAYSMAIYISTLMALATLVATPIVIRRALKGLNSAAQRAKDININNSGNRLAVENVPLEVLPFVEAVNDAFKRLDAGYEQHKRFLADAAHELRTPIAILTTRLSALPLSPLRRRLIEDASRLASLADQLLDLQRIDQKSAEFTDVNLVRLANRVVLDLAPLAFGASYEMSFEHEVDCVWVRGDEMSIERALVNLIQNAISYGGRRGTIGVSVAAGGWIEVCDEGAGIPIDQHELIFEPFQRVRQDGNGVGLGLNLVRKVMSLHGGAVSVKAGNEKGTCFRLQFPLFEISSI